MAKQTYLLIRGNRQSNFVRQALEVHFNRQWEIGQLPLREQQDLKEGGGISGGHVKEHVFSAHSGERTVDLVGL